MPLTSYTKGESESDWFCWWWTLFYVLFNQRILFLLNIMNFIYVFIESRIFVAVIMYGYYVFPKKKNACDELLVLNFS